MDYGAYTTSPGLLSRAPHLIEMQLWNKPDLSGFVLWGHQTLDDAYGNPTDSAVGGAGAQEMFSVVQGTSYRSPTLRRKRLGFNTSSMRNQTRAVWDPQDFADPTVGLPPEGRTLYVRIQEETLSGRRTVLGAVDNGDPVLGPIYVIPTVDFFGQPLPLLALVGTAPANTGSTFGEIPKFNLDGQAPNPMHIILPRTGTRIDLSNRSADTALLVAFETGQPMVSLAAGSSMLLQDVSVKEILLASASNAPGAGVAVSFSITASIVLGSR